MPTPSLLIVPARFKSGKLYSQIPTSGAGDFTVTRATTATRVNASGLIESVASGIPRLDYFASGGTVGCPALLVEPAATNLVPNGVGFNAATGVQTSGVTDSPAVAISGTLATKNEASGTIRYANQTFSATALASGTTYSVSRFFKYNGVAFTTSLQRNDALQWGSVGWQQDIVLSAASGVTLGASTLCTGSIENFGNGWYRVNVRVTTGATIGGSATVQALSLLPAALSTGQGFLIACPQLETGSVATSYIPTTTAAVTRNDDVVSVSGAVSGSIGQTEGSIYAEVNIQKLLGTTQRAIIDIGQSGNRLFLGYGNGITNQIRFLLQTSGGGLVDFQSAATTTGIIRIAVGYKNNDSAMYVNGVSVSPISNGSFTATLTSLTQLSIGSSFNVGETHFLNDKIVEISLFNTRLSNTALQNMTL